METVGGRADDEVPMAGWRRRKWRGVGLVEVVVDEAAMPVEAG